MNPDYIFIFLVILIILLFYLAIKHFKFLFFYLGVILGILLGTFGKIFIENNDFNLGFLSILFDNLKSFFSDSIIVTFLSENSGWLFIIFIIALLHRFFYYLSIILLHFFKWFTTGTLDWIGSRKEKKGIALEEIEFKKNIGDIKK